MTATLTRTYAEQQWKVIHTGLDGDGDQVHGEVLCESRDEAEALASEIRDWQYNADLPEDATVLTRSGTGLWVLLSSRTENGAAA
jgi:hypothetical protein